MTILYEDKSIGLYRSASGVISLFTKKRLWVEKAFPSGWVATTEPTNLLKPRPTKRKTNER